MTSPAPLWTRNYILLGATAVLTFTSFYFLLPILPIYLQDRFHSDKGTIGAIMGIFTMATILSRPLIGWLLDRGLKRGTFLVTTLAFALCNLPFLWAPGLALVLILRVLQGLAWGGTTACGGSIIVDFIPPSRRGEGIGLYGLSMTLAMAVGPMLALTLLGDGNFTLPFAVATVLGILAVGVLGMVRFAPHGHPTKPRPFNGSNILEPKVLPLGINLLFLAFTYGGLLAFIPLLANERQIRQPGLFFLEFAGGLALARFFSGRIYDRKGPYGLAITSMTLLILGFVLLSLTAGAPGFFAAAAIIGIGQGMVNPVFQAMVNDTVPADRRGTANATYFTAFDTGIGIGMILTGVLADHLGISQSFLVSAGACAVALLVFLTYTFPHFKRQIRS